MRTVVIIPARFSSSRYPGKPLVPLLGKPMILWVSELAAKAVGNQNVYVATDDDRIARVVEQAGFRFVMTGEAQTGTDRIADAALAIDGDIFINVQGDEPLVDPQDILNIRDAKLRNPEKVINGYAWLSDSEDPSNVNIPKVITNESDDLVYMSRLPIPGFKEEKNVPDRYKKQVCIYAFSKNELKKYREFGRKSTLEQCEDIEILRFFELGVPVLMVKTRPGSLAVDVPDDVGKVESALRALQS
ncbi:3-deoxy-manno-octulosonate cytidylyltransferase (CMP-KDO synthetase) [Marinobacter sp. es.048]|uniref:3-deoxy-manno-octulosonate cytidylyltransferase n=1 Tax=Marinobacter sp. es.048 TaxID=1761795 RepID=UPI000B5878A1|nr:3-deoxy-manno-octulosonate cytidylyltransferase [Marinobacter sp. es.048]SNC66965.1 3-deoxy-manno-octulosonate cytidylyltransferase (CMP-KDO synthetase) [Marinobacter sp. es.048]